MAWHDFGTIEPWRSDPDTGGAPVTVYAQDLKQILSDLCRAHNERASSALGIPTVWPISLRIQTITITNGDTTNWFKLTFDGQTTAEILWDASAATVQAALEALSSIGAGNVEVTLNDEAVEHIGAAGKRYTIEFVAAASGERDEIQTVTIGSGSGVDWFKLSFNGQLTDQLNWDADAATVQAALEALSSIGAGNVAVTLDALVYTVTFRGVLCALDVIQMTRTVSGCTATVATVTNGRGQWERALTSGGVSGCTLAVSKGKTYPAVSDFVDMRLSPISPSTELAAIVAALRVAPATGANVYWCDPAYDHVLTDAGRNASWTITITNGSAGDTFSVWYDDYTSYPVAWNVTAADLKIALESILTLNPGNVTVSGGSGVYTVTLAGGLAARPARELVAVGTGCTATVAITAIGYPPGEKFSNVAYGEYEKQTVTITNGSAGDWFKLGYAGAYTSMLDWNASAATVQAALNALVGSVTTVTLDEYSLNEVQGVTIGSGSGVDWFRLTFGGQQTGQLLWDASAATVQAALEALSSIGAGNVEVTLDALVYTVTFQGALGYQDVMQMTSAVSGCTATVATAQNGARVYTVTVDLKGNFLQLTTQVSGCNAAITTISQGSNDGVDWGVDPGLPFGVAYAPAWVSVPPNSPAPGWLRSDIYMQIREVLLNYRWVWIGSSQWHTGGTIGQSNPGDPDYGKEAAWDEHDPYNYPLDVGFALTYDDLAIWRCWQGGKSGVLSFPETNGTPEGGKVTYYTQDRSGYQLEYKVASTRPNTSFWTPSADSPAMPGTLELFLGDDFSEIIPIYYGDGSAGRYGWAWLTIQGGNNVLYTRRYEDLETLYTFT